METGPAQEAMNYNYATPMPPPTDWNVAGLKEPESVHQRLQHKKASLEVELNKVNLALSSLDANPHFANILSTVERALGRL